MLRYFAFCRRPNGGEPSGFCRRETQKIRISSVSYQEFEARRDRGFQVNERGAGAAISPYCKRRIKSKKRRRDKEPSVSEREVIREMAGNAEAIGGDGLLAFGRTGLCLRVWKIVAKTQGLRSPCGEEALEKIGKNSPRKRMGKAGKNGKYFYLCAKRMARYGCVCAGGRNVFWHVEKNRLGGGTGLDRENICTNAWDFRVDVSEGKALRNANVSTRQSGYGTLARRAGIPPFTRSNSRFDRHRWRERATICGSQGYPQRLPGQSYFSRQARRRGVCSRESDPIELAKDSAASKLLQRLRDEAHRFAISFNRNLRTKALTKSALDEISGIGPTTKKKLLTTFGSVPGVRQASDAELLKILNAKQLANIRKNLGFTLFLWTIQRRPLILG
ncbi:hypothetical protein HC823_00270 [Candidatus Gracilibacteria bacterium]|nr:hypothetical protein [Candidatus Gracilibacteria bacterium]